MRISHPDVLVVGAGFAGAVVARELAERGADVVVIDRRGHIAGNAYDEPDANGILVHRYGAHLFRAGPTGARDWLSRFTDWVAYEDSMLPAAGYTAMFRHVLHHRRIQVRLRTGFEDATGELRWRHLVWTGGIDEYFAFRHGPLPYTSLRFEWETVPTPGGGFHQPTAQVEYPGNEVPYVRSTEYRHFHPRRLGCSTIAYEHPDPDGERFFPVRTPASVQLHRQYLALAAGCRDVTFAGRLTRFRYLRMDEVVAQSLVVAPAVAAALFAEAA